MIRPANRVQQEHLDPSDLDDVPLISPSPTTETLEGFSEFKPIAPPLFSTLALTTMGFIGTGAYAIYLGIETEKETETETAINYAAFSAFLLFNTIISGCCVNRAWKKAHQNFKSVHAALPSKITPDSGTTPTVSGKTEAEARTFADAINPSLQTASKVDPEKVRLQEENTRLQEELKKVQFQFATLTAQVRSSGTYTHLPQECPKSGQTPLRMGSEAYAKPYTSPGTLAPRPSPEPETVKLEQIIHGLRRKISELQTESATQYEAYLEQIEKDSPKKRALQRQLELSNAEKEALQKQLEKLETDVARIHTSIAQAHASPPEIDLPEFSDTLYDSCQKLASIAYSYWHSQLPKERVITPSPGGSPLRGSSRYPHATEPPF